MFSTLRKLQLVLLLALLSIFSSCSQQTATSVSGTAGEVSGTVVEVVDGDTLTISDAQNTYREIRLKGIDAPEHGQKFGDASRDYLARLVFGKYVRIEYDKVDQYGRLVGTVWVNGNDECLEQLKAGLAWHYKHYETEQLPAERQLYAHAEQEARTQALGLWKDPSPTPPWEYRHRGNRSNDSRDGRVSPPPRNFSKEARALDRRPATAPTPSTVFTPKATSPIRGNKRSMIYHWPGCANYDDIAPHNRVPFESRAAAESAGYRAARNCH